MCSWSQGLSQGDIEALCWQAFSLDPWPERQLTEHQAFAFHAGGATPTLSVSSLSKLSSGFKQRSALSPKKCVFVKQSLGAGVERMDSGPRLWFRASFCHLLTGDCRLGLSV